MNTEKFFHDLFPNQQQMLELERFKLGAVDVEKVYDSYNIPELYYGSELIEDINDPCEKTEFL